MDDKVMSQFDYAADKFVADMDLMISKLDKVVFGDQWVTS